jgi:predicted acyl esterase
VIGPVRVRLYVQASVPYIDMHARLCDVTPRGISDGIVRLTDAPPGTRHPIEFDLWPVAHAFRRGHRIRLQVSGGAHPRYGRNLGTAEPFATGTHLQAPAHIYRAATAQCSTMPSTPPQCGYPYAADLQCRLPPGL